MGKLRLQNKLSKTSADAFRPEVQLILACARTRLNSESTKLIKELLCRRLDWAFILKKVHQHCILPMFYLNINRVCPEDVPNEILQQLRYAFRAQAHHNLYLTREMIKLLQLFDAQGMQALPLKGPVVAALIYGELSHRQFADLDILVRERDFPRAKVILASQGYEDITPLTRIQRMTSLISRRKDHIFVSPNRCIRVELHRRMTGRHFAFPLKMSHMWSHLENINVAGFTVCSLPPVMLLLFLCMHGSRHGWSRLQWICDIAEFIRAYPEMDLEGAWKEAHKLRNERNLALGLILASDLLDAPVPDVVMKKIKNDPMVKALTEQTRERLFADSPASSDISYWHDYHLRVKERMQDRIKLRLHYYSRYLRLAASPNIRDRAFVLLPPSLSFFYYLLRPIRLAKTYGYALFTRLRKIISYRNI